MIEVTSQNKQQILTLWICVHKLMQLKWLRSVNPDGQFVQCKQNVSIQPGQTDSSLIKSQTIVDIACTV